MAIGKLPRPPPSSAPAKLERSPRTGNRSHRDDDDAPIKEGPKKWSGLKTKRIEKVVFDARKEEFRERERKELKDSAELNADLAMPMPATQPQSRFRLEHMLHKDEAEKLEAHGVKLPANVLISKRQPRSPPLVGGRRPQVITIAEKIRSRREARRALGATSRRGSTPNLIVSSSSATEAAAAQNTPMAALLRCVQKCVDGGSGATTQTPAPGSPEHRAAMKGQEASLQSTSWAQPPAAVKQPSSMTVVSEANWVPKASSPAEGETPIAALLRRIMSSAHSCLSGLTGAPLPSESVKKAFETFDRNGNGSLDADELRGALAFFGLNTSATHTREMLARYDTNQRDGIRNHGKLDLNGFTRLVHDLNSAAQPPTFTKQPSSVVAQPPLAASAPMASSAAATAALARPGSAEAFAAQQKVSLADLAKQPSRSAAEWDVQRKAAAEKEEAAKKELARVAAAAERRASQKVAADEKAAADKAVADKAAAERIANEKAAAQKAAAEKAAAEKAAAQRAAAEKAVAEKASAEKAAAEKAAAEKAAAEKAAAEKAAAEKAVAEKVAAETAAAERLSKQQSTLTKQDLTKQQSSSPLKQDLTKQQTTGAGLTAAKPATPAASTPVATAQPVAAEERKSMAAVPPEAGSGRRNALARARAASSVGAMIASGISSAKRLVSGETTPISHAVAGAAPAGAAAKAPSQQNLVPAATASTQAPQLKKEPSAKHEERLATGQVPMVAGFQVAVKQDDPGDAAKAAGQEKAKAAAAAAKAAAEKAAAAQAAAQAARTKAAAMRSASIAAALHAAGPVAPAAPEGGSGAAVEKDLRPAPENAADAEPAGADIPVQHRTRHRVNFEEGPLGMGLQMSTDGWVMVSDVKEGQAAAQHGVLKGSYIVEVNGEKCDGLVQADVTNLLRKPGAREVIFALPLRKK